MTKITVFVSERITKTFGMLRSVKAIRKRRDGDGDSREGVGRGGGLRGERGRGKVG